VGLENARVENDGQKLRGLENAGLENDGQTFSKHFTPLSAMADYEEASTLAFQAVFGNVNISGCWFHYGQALVKRMAKIGLKDAYLRDESVTDVVRCLLGMPLLPANDIVAALQDIRTDYTAVSFSNWWRTSSVSGLTGILSVQIASVFVTIGRGRTTYSRVTILACAGEFKLATRTSSTS